jgi:hypothetical protein
MSACKTAPVIVLLRRRLQPPVTWSHQRGCTAQQRCCCPCGAHVSGQPPNTHMRNAITQPMHSCQPAQSSSQHQPLSCNTSVRSTVHDQQWSAVAAPHTQSCPQSPQRLCPPKKGQLQAKRQQLLSSTAPSEQPTQSKIHTGSFKKEAGSVRHWARPICSFTACQGMGRQRHRAAAPCHLCLQPCSSCASRSGSSAVKWPCCCACTVGTCWGHIRGNIRRV